MEFNEVRARASYPRLGIKSCGISGRRVRGRPSSANGVEVLNHSTQPVDVEHMRGVGRPDRRRGIHREISCLEGNGRVAAIG